MLRFFVGLAFVLSLLLPARAAAQFVQDEDLATGQAARLDQTVDTLLVTYRPSSSIARTDTLLNAARWTPDRAGVVKLATPGGGTTQNVSVRFDRLPLLGLGVLLGAGLILFGGAGYAFRSLFADDPPASS